jgi:glycerophosphoryl diester phosphodiesterase
MRIDVETITRRAAVRHSVAIAAVIAVVLSELLLLIAVFPRSHFQTRRDEAGGRPLIIAHRGGAKESTENTIGAFQRAMRIGADGIETDIRMTRDGVVVIYHDETIGRVEGLPRSQWTRPVWETTYPELVARALVPVGDDQGGRHVPRLDELLSSVETGLLNIEIKRNARYGELVNRTIAILRDYSGRDRVVLETPDLETAEKIRAALGPRQKLHINPAYDESVPFDTSLDRVLKFHPHSISVAQSKVTPQVVRKAHDSGVEVWAWTVNSPEDAARLASLGVDAIKTDCPSALLESLSH